MINILPLVIALKPPTTKTIVVENDFFDGISIFGGAFLPAAIWSIIIVLLVRSFFKMDKMDTLAVCCISVLIKTIFLMLYSPIIDFIKPMIDYEYSLLLIPIYIIIISLPIIAEGILYNLVLKYKEVGGIKIAILTECLPPMIIFVVAKIIGVVVHPVVW